MSLEHRDESYYVYTSLFFPLSMSCVDVIFTNGNLPVRGEETIALAVAWVFKEFLWHPFVQ